jgi:teichuronic acid biosynthesis protein TuaE
MALVGIGVSYSNLYAFHVIFPVAVLTWLLTSKTNLVKSVLKNRLSLVFLAMPLWYALSIVWSWNAEYSLRYLIIVSMVCAFGLFISAAINSKARIKQLLTAAGVVYLAETALGLLESFTPLRWIVSPFSPNADILKHSHSLDKFSGRQLESISITPTGFHWNPNELALWLCIGLPFVVFHPKLKGNLKTLLLLLVGIVIVMTGSRLCILVSMAILLFCWWQINRKKFLAGLAGFLGAMVLLIFINPYIESSVYGRKAYEVATTLDSVLSAFGIDADGDEEPEIDPEVYQESGLARMTLMKNGLKALAHTKGLGVGGGGAIAVQEQYEGYIGDSIKSMHNFWVEILVEAGVLFFVPFMLWYAFVCRQLWLIYKRCQDIEINHLALALFTAMVFFVPAAVTAASVM